MSGLIVRLSPDGGGHQRRQAVTVGFNGFACGCLPRAGDLSVTELAGVSAQPVRPGGRHPAVPAGPLFLTRRCAGPGEACPLLGMGLVIWRDNFSLRRRGGLWADSRVRLSSDEFGQRIQVSEAVLRLARWPYAGPGACPWSPSAASSGPSCRSALPRQRPSPIHRRARPSPAIVRDVGTAVIGCRSVKISRLPSGVLKNSTGCWRIKAFRPYCLAVIEGHFEVGLFEVGPA